MIRAALLLLLLAGSAAAGPARLAVEELRLPPVTLVDQHGRAQRLAGPGALAGPVVMTFAYTACQSICPLGGGIMAELDAALDPRRRRGSSPSPSTRGGTPRRPSPGRRRTTGRATTGCG